MLIKKHPKGAFLFNIIKKNNYYYFIFFYKLTNVYFKNN